MDASHRKRIGNLYRLQDRRLARLDAGTAHAPGVPTPRDKAMERLSAREVAVLQLVANGFTNREIGVCLSITEETVKSHVRQLLSKLPADNRAHAVSIAMCRHLISWVSTAICHFVDQVVRCRGQRNRSGRPLEAG